MPYAIGSREELEALTKHIEANARIALAYVRDGALEQAEEVISDGLLFAAMLHDAIKDHFVGRN